MYIPGPESVTPINSRLAEIQFYKECQSLVIKFDSLIEEVRKRANRDVLSRADLDTQKLEDKARELVAHVNNVLQREDAHYHGRRIRALENKKKELVREIKNTIAILSQKDKERITRDKYNAYGDDVKLENAGGLTETMEGNIYQQALLGIRPGGAHSTRQAVSNRHRQIEQLVRSLVALLTLFQELDVAIRTQEPAVVSVEEKGERAKENAQKGADDTVRAVESARHRKTTRRKVCIVIAAVVILLAAGVVVAVVVVNQGKQVVTGPRPGPSS